MHDRFRESSRSAYPDLGPSGRDPSGRVDHGQCSALSLDAVLRDVGHGVTAREWPGDLASAAAFRASTGRALQMNGPAHALYKHAYRHVLQLGAGRDSQQKRIFFSATL